MKARGVRQFFLLPLLTTLLMAAGCVEQSRRTSVGAADPWRSGQRQSHFGAGVPSLTPGSQRVRTNDMRLNPSVPQIMEHDSDFAGVKRGKK